MVKRGRLITFILCIIIVYAVAGIGSLFTSSAVNNSWYKTIKPALTPPNWVFPIVWNILFFLIALSLYFAWISGKKKERIKVATVFGINFILNILWSLFYFGMQNPLLSFVDIILLIISIALMITVTWKINRLSSWLLLPYLLWILFASVLNWMSI